MDIIATISQKLSIQQRRVEAVVSLLDSGATIPFISRYRKEATGSLDEVSIQDIEQSLGRLRELEKRKETVVEAIENAGAMTGELRQRIDQCSDSVTLEDIYLPFKPRRRTRAAIAREKGLEPLAKIIMSRDSGDIDRKARRFVNDTVSSAAEAIEGAGDIIAEWVNENERSRNFVRNRFAREAIISSKVIKGKEEAGGNYSQYFDFSEPLKRCSSHRYLAMRRGENEGILRVSISIDDSETIDRLDSRWTRQAADKTTSEIISKAVADGYRRLLRPSVENETAVSAKTNADSVAIKAFADNVRQLLMAPPLGNKRVLAIDPGFRTGCKIVCLDEQGLLMHNDVIYPTPPRNETREAARKIARLVESYKIDAISIGNGTASRETERFIKGVTFPRSVDVFVVNENGASVYSASKIAREEFPDKDVTVRGAVSIGRRLIDPLAELVKIDPKSIGVGQYQHDVDQTRLKEALDFTVMNCVNSVGVNVNTASPQLLAYVSGIGPALAANIVAYRTEHGDFTSRQQLKKVARLGDKAFEQCAGFLRIPGAENPLDNSAVHPESYHVVEQMARDLKMKVSELISNHDAISRIDLTKYVNETIGLPTLNDIVAELEKPGRDPRKKIAVFEFDPSVKEISDLKPDMELAGIVNNITDFGAFVDIGVHQSGLVHISQMSEKRISSPHDVVSLNQPVKVRVLEVDLDRKRIALTMKGVQQ